MTQIEEGAEDKEGQERPSLAPGLQIAQPGPPDEGHGEKNEGRLKHRDSGLERRPEEVRRNQSERQHGGTEAADHGRFHYTFRRQRNQSHGLGGRQLGRPRMKARRN